MHRIRQKEHARGDQGNTTVTNNKRKECRKTGLLSLHLKTTQGLEVSSHQLSHYQQCYLYHGVTADWLQTPVETSHISEPLSLQRHTRTLQSPITKAPASQSTFSDGPGLLLLLAHLSNTIFLDILY